MLRVTSSSYPILEFDPTIISFNEICWSSNTSLVHSLDLRLTSFFLIAMISYGLDLGELIQQYISLFWLVHTYNGSLAGQPSPHAPSLIHWGNTSFIWGIQV